MNKRRFSFYTILLGCGVLDACLWVLLFIHPIEGVQVSPVAFLALRGLLLGVLVFMMLSHASFDEFKPVLAVLLTSLFFLIFSVFGILCMLAIFQRLFSHSGQTAMLYHLDKEAQDLTQEFATPSDHVDILELRKVAPLIDGITDESKDNRIAAIQAMEQVMSSANIRNILLEAKNDPYKEVQYYANDALKKLGDAYTEKLKNMLEILNHSRSLFTEDYQRFLSRFPEVQPIFAPYIRRIDGIEDTIYLLVAQIPEEQSVQFDQEMFRELENKLFDLPYEVYKRVADLYARFADARIEHPVITSFYSQEAVKYYTYVLENYPEHRKEILENFIPILYQGAQYKTCLTYCEEVRNDPALSAMSIRYKARCLFQMRQISNLKTFIDNVKGTPIFSLDNLFMRTGHDL